MAIFGKKKAVKKVEKENDVVSALSGAPAIPHHKGSVLLSPRITEKSTILSEQGAYVFNVDKTANKRDIAAMVLTLFKVMPVKVRTVHIKSKTKRSRTTNRMGKTAAGKKAYVY